MKEIERKYYKNLKAGEYETLEIVENRETDGPRIRIKIFEERWRTPEETVNMLKEVLVEVALMYPRE